MYLPISQLVPSYPGGQVQLNEYTKSSQEPPFLHGLVSQLFMSANRKSTLCSLLRLVCLRSSSVFPFLKLLFSHLIINLPLDTYKTGFLENIAQLHKLIFVFVAFLISISVCLGEISSKYVRCSCNIYVHYTLFNSRCQYFYQ